MNDWVQTVVLWSNITHRELFCLPSVQVIFMLLNPYGMSKTIYGSTSKTIIF